MRVFAMASGAGHDAAVFAGQGVPTAMLFVRDQNGSHYPDEAMDFGNFAVGVRVAAKWYWDASLQRPASRAGLANRSPAVLQR